MPLALLLLAMVPDGDVNRLRSREHGIRPHVAPLSSAELLPSIDGDLVRLRSRELGLSPLVPPAVAKLASLSSKASCHAVEPPASSLSFLDHAVDEAASSLCHEDHRPGAKAVALGIEDAHEHANAQHANDIDIRGAPGIIDELRLALLFLKLRLLESYSISLSC